MQNLNDLRRDLVKRAQDLHAKEKRFVLDSVWLVGELDRLRCDTHLGMSVDQFVTHIGLTPNVYSKRLKASRILHAYPRAVAMLKAGETSISQIALLHAKLTPANADLVFAGIRNKSKREAEQFLSRVTFDGQLLDKEPEVELRLVLRQSQLAMLERAREVLAASGHVPSSVEILERALGDLLERRDPMRKAARAAARRERKQAEASLLAASSPGTDEADVSDALRPTDGADVWDIISTPSSPGTDEAGFRDATLSASSPGTAVAERPAPPCRPSSRGTRRPAIPAAVRHEVVLRDDGRCTEVLADGSRCPERMMLELDHRILWCRGGQHTVDNLSLKCRRHNQASAASILGERYLS